MKNVCIVGYGAIGPVHAKALEKVENARLYAVCDIDDARRALCLKTYEVIEYADYDQMLENQQIHSVHICTPHYLHFDMIKKALAAGKDVVVEKPVTMTKSQFEELKTLDGVERVCVVFQNRLNPCMVKLKSLVEDRSLGKVLGARGLLTWYRSKEYYESDDWRGKWATEGGGVLINQAIHTLDYFSYLLGKVTNVKAHMCDDSLEQVIEVEDTVAARLEFASGITGVFYATNGYFKNSTPIFEVAFEKGAALYLDRTLWINGQIVATDDAPEVGKAYWGSGHAGLLKRYYDEQKYFTVKDAENTMETVFAMYDSAKHDGRVTIV